MRIRSSVLATASVVALAVPVLSGAAAIAGTDNPKACFGQDSAAGVATLRAAGVNWGSQYVDSASDRKGDNARQNAEYREACRAE